MHPVEGLFARHAWATTELLGFCAGLKPPLLEIETPGTYGGIRSTLSHLIQVEQGYLSILTGQPAGAELGPGDRAKVDALRPLADENAARWRSLLYAGPEPDRRSRLEWQGQSGMVVDWVVMVQAVHHGDDHRAQVASALGAAGVQPPVLDGWMFGRKTQGDGAATGAWADRLLLRFLSHSAWATCKLLDHCASLGNQALAATAPGTDGTVQQTLTHLVDSDGSLLNGLVGGADVHLGGSVELDSLRRRAELWAEGWQAYLAGRPDHSRIVGAGGRRRAPAWVLIVQAVHHADELRANLGTILGANYMPVPQVDLWAYSMEARRAPG